MCHSTLSGKHKFVLQVLQDTPSHAAALIRLWSQLIFFSPRKAHSEPCYRLPSLSKASEAQPLAHNVWDRILCSAPIPTHPVPECLRQTAPSTAMWAIHHQPHCTPPVPSLFYGRSALPTHLAAAQALPFCTWNPLSHSPFQPWAQTSSSFTLRQTSPEKSSVILREGRSIKNKSYCIQ